MYPLACGSSGLICRSQLHIYLRPRLQRLYLPPSAQSTYRYTTKTSPPSPYKPRKSSAPTVPPTSPASGNPSVPRAPTLSHVSAPSPKLNPPASTLPPSLDLPTREPSQSAISYYFRLGRAYLSFYKSGLWAVFTNWKISQPLYDRLASAQGDSARPAEGLKNGLLSRAEFQLLRRTKRDVARIPPFMLVFIVCGEFTPLVVMFMSGVVPRTCWVPKQVQAAREKQEERRRQAFRSGGNVEVFPNTPTGMSQAQNAAALHICQSLGLYPAWWDRTGFHVMPVIRRRAEKRIEELEADDFGIRRDGGVEGLEMEEVRIAAEERGLDILGRPDEEVRELVERWVGNKKGSLREMLLVRPNMWKEG